MFRNMNYDIKDIYSWPLNAQAVLLALASIVILYFTYLFDISYLRREIAANVGQIQDLKDQYKKLIDQQISMETEIAKIPSLQGILREWQIRLISEDEVTSLLDQILKLGTGDRIQFSLFEPQKAIQEEGYLRQEVNVRGTGSYDEIASFLSQVANMPKLIEIDNVTITKNKTDQNGAPTPDATSGGELPLVISVTLNIFRKQP